MLFFAPTIGLLLLISFTSCISVQFSPAVGDKLAEYKDFKSIEQQKALSNYIITSRPYRFVNLSEPTNSKWRRELYVSTTLGTNSFEPTESSFSTDCASNSQSCQNFLKQEDNPTFKPYSQVELEKILKEYSKDKSSTQSDGLKLSNSIITKDALYSTAASTILSAVTGSPANSITQDKPKSWNHGNQQKNPYDDRQGWVTLEPVAWSSSQVQKWEPNPNRPTWPVPSEVGHWNGGTSSTPTPHYPETSSWTTDRPWKQPTYNYGTSSSSRPPLPSQSHFLSQIGSSHPHYGSHKPTPSDIYGPPSNWGGGNNNPDIITDGKPDYFPPDRPTQSHNKPWDSAQSAYGIPQKLHTQVVYQGPISNYEKPSYPSDGEGHWVLLSSTKGYSIPQRHRNMARSLRFAEDEPSGKPKKNPQVSSHRTVRLTVLPPLNGTTSTQITHGGMLEVEKTEQTVDEAHREHLARSLKFSRSQKGTGNSTIERVTKEPSSAVISSSQLGPAKAVSARSIALAAVGAGIIPATMAMILPVILARKKRSEYKNLAHDSRRYKVDTITVLPHYQIYKEITEKKPGKRKSISEY